MKDLITLCKLSDLRKELTENGYVIENAPYLPFDKIPTRVSKIDGYTVSLVRCNEEDLTKFKSIQILGCCIKENGNNVYAFDDKNCQKLYEDHTGVLEVKSYTDEEGNVVTYKEPYLIGVFA